MKLTGVVAKPQLNGRTAVVVGGYDHASGRVAVRIEKEEEGGGGAHLVGARLVSADLTGARTGMTNMVGANLSGAKLPSQIKKARVNHWP